MALYCSMDGLYENELCLFLGANKATFLPVYYALLPYLRPDELEEDASAQVENIMAIDIREMTAVVKERYFIWKREDSAEGGPRSSFMITGTLPSASATRQTEVDNKGIVRKSWQRMHRELTSFFRSQCYNPRAKRREADDAIADAMSKISNPAAGGDSATSVGEALANAVNESESSGDIWLHSTKENIRGLRCITYHLRQAELKTELARQLTDMHFIAASVSCGLVYEVVSELMEARRVLLWGRASQRGWRASARLYRWPFVARAQVRQI